MADKPDTNKKKVTFSAEPDDSPDGLPLPDPQPITTAGVEAIGVTTQAPPSDALAEADALIAEVAKSLNPKALPEVKWVQFLQNVKLAGRGSGVGAVSANAGTRIFLDRELGCVEIQPHNTLVPLSNVCSLGMA